jgi:hypothetical protein
VRFTIKHPGRHEVMFDKSLQNTSNSELDAPSTTPVDLASLGG